MCFDVHTIQQKQFSRRVENLCLVLTYFNINVPLIVYLDYHLITSEIFGFVDSRHF